MQRINPEGLYKTIQTLLPVFASQNWEGRIIVVSPPIYSRFFRGKTAYAMGKIAMSVMTKGLAMDWAREGRHGMAITSIWPATGVQSGATRDMDKKDLRKPVCLPSPAQTSLYILISRQEIFSDAILAMLAAPTQLVNGLIDTDEDFLRTHAGVSDFSKYSLVQGSKPRRMMPAEFPDLTVAEQDDEGDKRDSVDLRKSKI